MGHRLTLAAVAILAALAIIRIAATWSVYTVTYDEPYHLAGGMEWLDRGTYTQGPMHPPLARVLAAFPLFDAGYHVIGLANTYAEGTAILQQRGNPERAIAIARRPILLFLLLAVAVVFDWAQRLAGNGAGLGAVLVFTSIPPVLAHAGLVTTDAAAMGTIGVTLYLFVRWLQDPTRAPTVLLGVALGFALLAKMSALVFLPACMSGILVLWITAGHRLAGYGRPAAVALGFAFLLLWAGYRFSVGPVLPGMHWFVPAPEFPRGFLQMLSETAKGRRSYLLGDAHLGGRWFFFPVALAVKTPLPTLLLAGLGIVTLCRRARTERLDAAPVLAAAMILLVALPANLNTGLRHILPIYPLLAICAGVGLDWLWRRHRIGAILAAGLAGWLMFETVRVHPDYLPYFNQLAGDHPEHVLVDSDLDWGQDLGRMVDTLRSRQVPHVWITYHGTADLTTQGLPPFTVLKPDTEVTGWVAASIYSLQLGEQNGRLDGFAWLRHQTPVTRAGHSMLLYHLEPDAVAGTAHP